MPGWHDVVPAGWGEASSEGRVRRPGGEPLAPTFDRDGYPRVSVGRRKVRVATLVCLAWHGVPEVRHMNDDRQDPRPQNVAWGSRRENEKDKRREEGRENRYVTVRSDR